MAMTLNVAKVQRPLASAAKMVQAGNRISAGPSPEGNFIEHCATGEVIPLRVDTGTFVFEVEFDGGEPVSIMLDSGASVSVARVTHEQAADATERTPLAHDGRERDSHREPRH